MGRRSVTSHLGLHCLLRPIRLLVCTASDWCEKPTLTMSEQVVTENLNGIDRYILGFLLNMCLLHD